MLVKLYKERGTKKLAETHAIKKESFGRPAMANICFVYYCWVPVTLTVASS
jgi:hypothetical protein